MTTQNEAAHALLRRMRSRIAFHRLGESAEWSDTDAVLLRDAVAAIEAATGEQPVQVSQRWKLVPIEPTTEMVAAMAKAWQDAVEADDPNECVAEYRAALAAAPHPTDVRATIRAEVERVYGSPQPTEAAALDIDTLVARFLAWPLPDDVCSDDCATQAGYPHRTGTVLLTAEQAKQMLLHVLGRVA